MENEMVERVAKALYAQQTEQGVHVYPAWDDCKEWIKELHRRSARAAIDAMEPFIDARIDRLHDAYQYDQDRA